MGRFLSDKRDISSGTVSSARSDVVQHPQFPYTNCKYTKYGEVNATEADQSGGAPIRNNLTYLHENGPVIGKPA